MKKKSTVQPLSENTRKAIIIAAIVMVAVIILSVALALILKPAALSPDDESNSNPGSSSLSIRNGDFAYTSSEDTAFPRTAQNWTRYGYKKASGSTHDFQSINDHSQAVMGVVNLSEDPDEEDGWAKVLEELPSGVTVTNPGLHKGIEDGNDDNSNVYMIASRGEPTAASILSDSASISSGASVKITIRINTAQLAEGSEAVIMIQKSTVSAKATNWYAYDFHVAKLDASSDKTDENGWQELTFHIFNRESSTKYIRVSIGLGNVYSGEEALPLDEGEPIKGEGVLFIDDITYETVTANDYREVVDAEGAEDSTMYKIIENEDIVEKSRYIDLTGNEEWKNGEHTTWTPYTDSKTYADDAANGYSPFTTRDDFTNDEGEDSGFTIHELHHDGTAIIDPLSFRLGEIINVKSSLLQKDHHHISFWVRVNQENKAAYANVFVQKKVGVDEYEDLTSGKWTVITTSQDIEKDANCGWVKYDIYIKPATQPEEISILFVLGKNEKYTDEECKLGLVPKGSMFVTSPAYEKIAYNDYNSASSGSYVKKLDLVGTSASTTITNGSFSTLDSTGRQPSSWTPAFAGDNSIYKDGKGNDITDESKRLAKIVEGSGTVQNFEFPVVKDDTVLDDAQKNVLQIKNNDPTSYGYFSTDITLSAKTAYVISAMFKAGSADLKPFIYLIDAKADAYADKEDARSQRIIASATADQNIELATARLLGYDYDEFGNGWTRYFMIVVTGDESMSVRLALFNGSIDGTTTQKGTVYYDKVEMRTLGTYSFVEADDEEKAENDFYETHYKVQWTKHPYVTATKANVEAYGENFGELLEKTVETEEGKTVSLLESLGIEVNTVGLEDMDERTIIPEEKEPEENPGEEEPTEPNDVNLGFLFSVISSVVLVAALLVVFVVKVYKNKGRITKAA